MYLEKKANSAMQFLLSKILKKEHVNIDGYCMNLTGKFNEIILFNYKEIYKVNIQLIRLYPELDDPRVNIAGTYFEIDGVEINKDLLIKAIEQRNKMIAWTEIFTYEMVWL